jgi:ABC-type Fe3+ transport system substrate-binding protein
MSFCLAQGKRLQQPGRGHRVRTALGAGFLATALVVVAGATSSTAATPAASGSPAAQFAALVSAARKSNHKVTAALSTYTPALLQMWQNAFKKEFGFSVDLVNVPGHEAIDIPTKVIAAAPSGDGVVDYLNGVPIPYLTGMFDAGDFQEPDWMALEYKWPIIKSLRSAVKPDLQGKIGLLSNYVFTAVEDPYVLVYNTSMVTASQAKALTWEDLTEPQWKGKVAVDGSGGATAYLAITPGVGVAGMNSFLKGLVSNGVQPETDGSLGVIQAVERGQAAIGISNHEDLAPLLKKGVPLAYVIAPISSTVHEVPVSTDMTGLVKPGVDNLSMAELWMGWLAADGLPLAAKIGAGGPQRLDLAESSVFPLARQISAAGFTSSEFINEDTSAEITAYADATKAGGQILSGGGS